MGLFSRNKTKPNPVSKLNWNYLTELESLSELINDDSSVNLIFKHSTRCAVSIMALKSFEGLWSLSEEQCRIHFLDLLNHRDISNQIAADFGIVHESPQVIVFKGKEVLYHDSHSDINVRKIESIIRKLK